MTDERRLTFRASAVQLAAVGPTAVQLHVAVFEYYPSVLDLDLLVVVVPLVLHLPTCSYM